MAKYEKIPSVPTRFTNGEGRQIQGRLYEDGAIRNEKGQLLRPHPKGHVITREDSSDLRARGIAMHQKAGLDGLAAAISRGLHSQILLGSAESWGLAVGLVTENLYSRIPRDRVDAINALSKILPVIPDKNATSTPEYKTISEIRGLIGDLSEFIKQNKVQIEDKQPIDITIVE